MEAPDKNRPRKVIFSRCIAKNSSMFTCPRLAQHTSRRDVYNSSGVKTECDPPVELQKKKRFDLFRHGLVMAAITIFYSSIRQY